MPIVDFRLGDVVRLRKPHPCGGTDWTVYRIGADIGFDCDTCRRRVLLGRRVAEKRLKQFLTRGPEIDPEVEAAFLPLDQAAPEIDKQDAANG
jgi:hypothetical protein